MSFLLWSLSSSIGITELSSSAAVRAIVAVKKFLIIWVACSDTTWPRIYLPHESAQRLRGGSLRLAAGTDSGRLSVMRRLGTTLVATSALPSVAVAHGMRQLGGLDSVRFDVMRNRRGGAVAVGSSGYLPSCVMCGTCGSTARSWLRVHGRNSTLQMRAFSSARIPGRGSRVCWKTGT